MHLYKIIITGKGVCFDNYGSPEPVIGFIACRLIRAESEELAVAIAKRDILVHWNQSFNADRKTGLPQLQLEKISKTRRWRVRKPKHDYYFFTSEADRTAKLEKLLQAKKRWFSAVLRR